MANFPSKAPLKRKCYCYLLGNFGLVFIPTSGLTGPVGPDFEKFTSLWQIFDGLFLNWPNNKPTFLNLLHYLANFIVANGQILKHNLTVTNLLY